MEKQDDINAKSVKTYELGYLVTPLLPEEKVLELVESKIKAQLTKIGAKLKEETGPKMMALAYPIRQVVEHKSSTFKESYFGSIRFELGSESIVSFTNDLKKIVELVRTLLIILPKDYNKKVERRIPPPAAAKSVLVPEGSVEAEAKPAVMTDEAIDKEIDSLLTPNK